MRGSFRSLLLNRSACLGRLGRQHVFQRPASLWVTRHPAMSRFFSRNSSVRVGRLCCNDWAVSRDSHRRYGVLPSPGI